jgi:hypothetical protein
MILERYPEKMVDGTPPKSLFWEIWGVEDQSKISLKSASESVQKFAPNWAQIKSQQTFRIGPRSALKSDQNHPQNWPKLSQNRPKIYQNCLKIGPKSSQNRPQNRLKIILLIDSKSSMMMVVVIDFILCCFQRSYVHLSQNTSLQRIVYKINFRRRPVVTLVKHPLDLS